MSMFIIVAYDTHTQTRLALRQSGKTYCWTPNISDSQICWFNSIEDVESFWKSVSKIKNIRTYMLNTVQNICIGRIYVYNKKKLE